MLAIAEPVQSLCEVGAVLITCRSAEHADSLVRIHARLPVLMNMIKASGKPSEGVGVVDIRAGVRCLLAQSDSFFGGRYRLLILP
jgi:hypothetical protein